MFSKTVSSKEYHRSHSRAQLTLPRAVAAPPRAGSCHILRAVGHLRPELVQARNRLDDLVLVHRSLLLREPSPGCKGARGHACAKQLGQHVANRRAHQPTSRGPLSTRCARHTRSRRRVSHAANSTIVSADGYMPSSSRSACSSTNWSKVCSSVATLPAVLAAIPSTLFLHRSTVHCKSSGGYRCLHCKSSGGYRCLHHRAPA